MTNHSRDALNATSPPDSDTVSKSQRKREMTALQQLGEALVELPEAQLRSIELPEALSQAVQLARRLKPHEGRRRQLQYIGKLMRTIDSSAIRQALAALNTQQRQDTAAFHQLEQWRERLLNQGDEALGALLAQHPQADRQYLRQLIRNAQNEATAGKPPKSSRLLFKYLRDLIQ